MVNRRIVPPRARLARHHRRQAWRGPRRAGVCSGLVPADVLRPPRRRAAHARAGSPRRRVRRPTRCSSACPRTLTPDEIRASSTACVRAASCRSTISTATSSPGRPSRKPRSAPSTDRYFKPWFEPAWNYDLRMGMLPLRHAPATVPVDRVGSTRRTLGRAPPAAVRRRASSAGPTHVGRRRDGQIARRRPARRVAPRAAARRARPDVLAAASPSGTTTPSASARPPSPATSPTCATPATTSTFPAYWRLVTTQPRAACRPAATRRGPTATTSRLYAGAAVVTIDYRQRDMLVPLPRGEHGARARRRPDRSRRARSAGAVARGGPISAKRTSQHLERYLHYGSYARSRAALIERFVAVERLRT